MRLIDADALNAEMYRKSFEVDDGRNVWNSGLWIRYKIFEEAIRDAPTVDAASVRHGKWIRQTDTRFGEMLNDILICSECQIAFSTVTMIRRSYCPNCGARMEEE